jgi:large subunit ribosomal protein L21
LLANFPRYGLKFNLWDAVAAASENWGETLSMSYAIVRTGGKQYRANVGETIDVEKLPFEAGEVITLEEVLLIAHDNAAPSIGKPLVSGASVKATVVKQYRGPKIIVWKYKAKQRYRRRKGHRQYYTRLKIDAIVGI